jgi:hypothetical protein
VTDQPKRRWYQFSLRTLLILITLICVGPGGIIAYEQQKARRQWAAVAAIEKVSGGVNCDDEAVKRSPLMRAVLGDDRYAHIASISLRPPKSRQSFPSLKEFPDVTALYVGHALDANLTHLKPLANLQCLDLRDTEVTSDGLKHLIGLTRLEGLQLRGTKVDNAGIAQLANLRKLTLLDLGWTRVTDASLGSLSRFESLERLYLSRTAVTDEGIARLASSPRLNYLDLTDTQVTDAGVEKLRQALPSLEIDRNRRWDYPQSQP